MDIESLQNNIQHLRSSQGMYQDVSRMNITLSVAEYETIVDSIIDLKERVTQLEKETI